MDTGQEYAFASRGVQRHGGAERPGKTTATLTRLGDGAIDFLSSSVLAKWLSRNPAEQPCCDIPHFGPIQARRITLANNLRDVQAV